eukprot:1033785-Pyramimonas_sp.AAC.1
MPPSRTPRRKSTHDSGDPPGRAAAHQEVPHQEPASRHALAVSEDPRATQSTSGRKVFGDFRILQKFGSLDLVSDEEGGRFQAPLPWRLRVAGWPTPRGSWQFLLFGPQAPWISWGHVRGHS